MDRVRRYAECVAAGMGLKLLRDETFDDTTFSRSFFRVGYDAAIREAELGDRFRGVAGLYCGLITRRPRLEREARRLGWNALMRLASTAGMSTKTPVWAHEREWRHVVFPQHGVELAPVHWHGSKPTHEHHLVPMRAKGRPLALSEIIVGRSQPFEPARQRITDFLRGLGYGSEATAMPAIVEAAAP